MQLDIFKNQPVEDIRRDVGYVFLYVVFYQGKAIYVGQSIDPKHRKGQHSRGDSLGFDFENRLTT